MTPATIIELVAAEGISLAVSESGNIKARGAGEAIQRWEPMLRQRKQEILHALKESAGQQGLSVFNVDQFEERAAIMEYDGGLTRDEAERLAAEAQGWSVGELKKRRVLH